jgi:large subunit ribosomal protein L25
MEVGKLSVEFRNGTGKTAARRLRVRGQIPAICYGGGADPLPVAVDPVLLQKALDPVKKTNTVIKLQVTGVPGGDQELTVMVRDHQRDALRGHLTHADFIRVQLDKDVHAVVPIVLIGKAEGVKLGGIMHQVIHRLEVACKPHLIPVKLEIDVTALNMGEAIHVRDLKLPEGVRALADGGTSVCSVTAPKAEKVEAAPVEGAVPAEGAAGAPAEGAAAAPAGAKPGAAAPAAAAPAAGAKPAKEEKKGKKE